jgi:PAP2 superfamily protein
MIINRILPVLILVGIFTFILSCTPGEPADPSFKAEVNPKFQEEAKNPEFIHRSVKQLTDVIVHDIFSPPVASRIYAYPCIAAYECLRNTYPSYKSLDGQLHELKNVPQPEQGKEYCFPLASVHSFLKTGKVLIFSEEKIEEFQAKIYQEFKDLGMPKEVYDNSIAFGDLMSDHIINWSKSDMYSETRTYPKYTITKNPDKWKPTPPDYMDGIEPHWKEIRTMVIDSAAQFAPPPPTPFSIEKNSQFYKETMEVYNVVKNANEEELAIAQFWDCNPYVSHHTGHVMYATKKITPGGHWMGITDIATHKANADMMKTMEAYTLVSINLFDAFISCWEEKYKSNLIRPETVINNYFDENWQPTLQTPPFPEHTSGHSVISTASAVALTNLFGENFSFVDSTEVEYGLPPRSFNSFLGASSEAAVSRLYGGIHYRPAIDYGVAQGKKVGELIASRLKTQSGK